MKAPLSPFRPAARRCEGQAAERVLPRCRWQPTVRCRKRWSITQMNYMRGRRAGADGERMIEVPGRPQRKRASPQQGSDGEAQFGVAMHRYGVLRMWRD